MIFDHTPVRLQKHLAIRCFSCLDNKASHICRFKLGSAHIQLCLCDGCMGMNKSTLMVNILEDPGREALHPGKRIQPALS